MRACSLLVLCGAIGLCWAGVDAAWAGGAPRSAKIMKESGNQFLAAKKYADAIDSYFQALEIFPDYGEAHYNLGVAFLKGYKQIGLARYHLQRYLELESTASDRENVGALLKGLEQRPSAPVQEKGKVIGVVGGRLLLSGSGWAKTGDRLQVSEAGKAPCASMTADVVYPDCVLTQRLWDEKALETVKEGFVAVNLSP